MCTFECNSAHIYCCLFIWLLLYLFLLSVRFLSATTTMYRTKCRVLKSEELMSSPSAKNCDNLVAWLQTSCLSLSLVVIFEPNLIGPPNLPTKNFNFKRRREYRHTWSPEHCLKSPDKRVLQGDDIWPKSKDYFKMRGVYLAKCSLYCCTSPQRQGAKSLLWGITALGTPTFKSSSCIEK